MKERPILFSGPMVRAILAGTKTQTRRVIKPQPETQLKFVETKEGFSSWVDSVLTEDEGRNRLCPFGSVGDRLWVRTRYYLGKDSQGDDIAWDSFTRCIRWKKSGIGPVENCEPELLNSPRFKFRPSIFMYRWASIITLEIAAIRVERLQDITIDDSIKEGIPKGSYCFNDDGGTMNERLIFSELWDFCTPKYPWDSNPWVWAMEFRRIV